jgi:hypothetical protein
MANLLNEVGVRVGHEAWFNPQGDRTEGLDGDVAWPAFPGLDEFEGPVALQVRHPMAVINSLVGIEMFTDTWHGAYQDFMFFHEPALVGENLHDAMRWYVNWNRRAQRFAGFTYRIEDLSAPLLEELTAFLGFPVEGGRCEAAISAMPTSHEHPIVNHRDRATLAWVDLPDGQLKDEVAEIASEFGYML